jgi:DNA-binding CsgD family transcriptional regulator
MACSTASKWFTRALEKLNLDRIVVPLALVIAAQTETLGRRGPVGATVDARSGTFQHGEASFLFISLARPVIGPGVTLSPSESEVAKRHVEGDSRWEIASHRSTSTQTVACQFRAVYSKLDATGRYAVIRRALDLGWFSSTLGP